MKSYLSKLGVLLFGAMFAVAACQDYDEDIRLVESELTADINELSSKLDAAIADLEGKADKADLEAALEAIEEAEDAIGRLEAADTDLQNQINTALAEVQGHIETLYANDELLTNNLNDLAGKVTSNEAKIAAVETELAAVKAQVETLIGKVAANEEAIAALQQADKDLQAAIKAEEAAREQAIEAAKTALTAYVDAEIEKVEALIDAETKAREAADAKLREDFAKADADLKAELKALIDANTTEIQKLDKALKDLEARVATLEGDVEAVKNAIKEIKDELAKVVESVNTIISRVQSLVYVPEYDDAKATLNFAKVVSLSKVTGAEEIAYVPGKSSLRFKVNSTVASTAADIVAAYELDSTILSFDLENAQVRSVEEGASLEIVGVSVDDEGYLVVDVLAQDFNPAFYQKTMSYSAALVLAQEEEMNNVASEFTVFVPTQEPDQLNLVVKYTKGENENDILYNMWNVDLRWYGYVNTQLVPSHETDKVLMTTPSTPYITVVGDTEFYTEETLYKEYGYQVEITSTNFVTSFDKDGKSDLNPALTDISWENEVVKWNEENYVVTGADAAGTAREVNLTSYEEADKAKYDSRVGSYLEVVDAYYFAGQKIAVADKIEIAKNLVYVNFEAVTYDWTLQRALDLRAADGTPYAESIVLNDVSYDNIYDLNPIFTPGNIKDTKVTLNDAAHHNFFFLSDIKAPKAATGTPGTADVRIGKGYQFAAADADKPNTYKVVWQTVLSESTDAIITLTVTLGKYPEAVVVESEVDLDLITEGTDANNFKGFDTLVADAYAELTPELAGFAEDAKVNDLMYAALVDAANTVVNEPNAQNLNLVVDTNADKSFVVLYMNQIDDKANVLPTYTFKRDIETWFGVPFQFVVTATPKLPKVELVRSTEYAYATETEDVYKVNLKAGIDDVTGLYTVKQSDLAFYLNVIGEANVAQSVTFAVLDGAKSTISNNTTKLTVLDTPISNPLVGDITAYLAKNNSILTWMDSGIQIKVKATLWAGAYPVDYATLELNVEDPLTFTAENITVDRLIKDDTVVKVYQNFKLTSTVEEHANIPNLLDVTKDSLADILTADAVVAYGTTIKVQKVSVYEKLGENEADKVLYDESKYEWNETTGILTLKKDDAAVLINPIEAHIKVTFSHNVHGTSEACPVTKDIFVTFQQPK